MDTISALCDITKACFPKLPLMAYALLKVYELKKNKRIDLISLMSVELADRIDWRQYCFFTETCIIRNLYLLKLWVLSSINGSDQCKDTMLSAQPVLCTTVHTRESKHYTCKKKSSCILSSTYRTKKILTHSDGHKLTRC